MHVDRFDGNAACVSLDQLTAGDESYAMRQALLDQPWHEPELVVGNDQLLGAGLRQELSQLRDELARLGVILEDTRDGTTWKLQS